MFTTPTINHYNWYGVQIRRQVHNRDRTLPYKTPARAPTSSTVSREV